MSKSMQKILAAVSVAMALLLMVPAPSWAAQARKPASDHNVSLMAQVWSWLESLLGDSKPQQRNAPGKTIMITPQPLPPPPEQGPLIDPNGASGNG
jgi:hypothetical protein